MTATIYDVARRAGVSTATVSKVLSNTPYVSEPTRLKVLEAVEALDYVPSLAAKGLSKARTYIIGLVIPYTSDYLFSDPHLLEIIRGIERIARGRGYSLMLSTGLAAVHRGIASNAMQPILRSKYADGVILLAASALPGGQPEISNRPCVSIGYSSPIGQGNTVHSDDRQGAIAATRHLLSLGHRRIGLISATTPITALTRRLEGHRETLREAGIAFDPALLTWGDFSPESGYAAAGQLLALAEPPTAIFAFNDRMAMGAIRRLREADVAIPDEMAVVGFDDIPAAAYFDPALTTVRQPAQAMGEQAAQMILGLIEGNEARFVDAVLPAELVIRRSSGASLQPIHQGGLAVPSA